MEWEWNLISIPPFYIEKLEQEQFDEKKKRNKKKGSKKWEY